MKPTTTKLVGVALAVLVIPAAVIGLSQGAQLAADPRVRMAQTVRIEPGSFTHMQPGSSCRTAARRQHRACRSASAARWRS